MRVEFCFPQARTVVSMGDDLMYTNLAGERLSRALRQMERMQAARRAVGLETSRLGAREMPESWLRLHQQFEDEAYFMIVAVRQAISARTVLVERGHDMPE